MLSEFLSSPSSSAQIDTDRSTLSGALLVALSPEIWDGDVHMSATNIQGRTLYESVGDWGSDSS